ncbi:MAG: VOC family protein [Candidatus Lutacidiplasmatales archaeon]
MSKVKAVPEGLHTVTAALAVDGASEAIAFYKRAFGAEEVMRAPDPSGKKIWHASIRIGDSQIFVNDIFPDMPGGANKAKLWIYAENVDALFKRATEAGATVRMPLADMFWGDRVGTVVDRWGNEWSLAQHIKDMTPDEMKKAQDAFVAAIANAKKN